LERLKVSSSATQLKKKKNQGDDFGTMPSRTKNGTIVEVTDLPVTSQLNGWLEGRQTSFFFRLLSKIVGRYFNVD